MKPTTGSPPNPIVVPLPPAVATTGGQPESIPMPVALPQPAAGHLNELVVQAESLLDEHHVVAVSRNIGLRERFYVELTRHLHAMVDTQTCAISGSGIHDLDSFCVQLERVLHSSTGAKLKRTIDGPGGICERLRDRPTDLASHLKLRYYIWRDADVLLKHKPALFGKLVDAITGIAAEAEYASEDLLLIHRVIFIGGTALSDYLRDEHGQFRRWLPESPGGSKPLWAVVSGLERPPVEMMELG